MKSQKVFMVDNGREVLAQGIRFHRRMFSATEFARGMRGWQGSVTLSAMVTHEKFWQTATASLRVCLSPRHEEGSHDFFLTMRESEASSTTVNSRMPSADGWKIEWWLELKGSTMACTHSPRYQDSRVRRLCDGGACWPKTASLFVDVAVLLAVAGAGRQYNFRLHTRSTPGTLVAAEVEDVERCDGGWGWEATSQSKLWINAEKGGKTPVSWLVVHLHQSIRSA